jgi:hypothetical protein
LASREEALEALAASPGAFFMRRDLTGLIEEAEVRLDGLAGTSGREALIHALVGRIGALREALKYVKPPQETL